MKKTGKIIIDIRNDIGDYEAVEAVHSVIACGEISKGAKDKMHYCWHTEFHNGIHVSVRPKYKTNSNIFVVYKKPYR